MNYVKEGEDVLRIVDRSNMRARILVRDWEVQDIKMGQPVKIQVLAHPYSSYEGRIEKILPAAALDQPVSQPFKLERQGQAVANYFAVEVLIPNPDGSLHRRDDRNGQDHWREIVAGLAMGPRILALGALAGLVAVARV